MALERKTVLQQKRIASVNDALQEFAPVGNDVPLVLVPDERSCLSCCLTIPTGPHSIMHKFGKDAYPDSLAPSGLQFLCSCYRIAYCVSQQAVTYTAPVKSCPTADNVMVDCDLTLVFSIGPDQADVKKFVYKLGARRFDEFLFAAVEEGIRHLIRNCNHTEVYELKGGNNKRVQATLSELNKKFNIFGVHFSSCAITEVKFSQDLQVILQQTTEFQSKFTEEEKRQKNQMDQIEYTRGRELQELDKQHMRVIQDLQASRTRTEIDREKARLEAVGNAEVTLTRQQQDAKVAEAQAKSEKSVAQQQGLTQKENLVSNARAADHAARIAAKAQAEAEIFQADKRKEAAARLAEALILEADSEERAAGSLKVKREHELKMLKSEILQELAASNKIVIGGEQGDRLLQEILDQGVMGPIKLA